MGLRNTIRDAGGQSGGDVVLVGESAQDLLPADPETPASSSGHTYQLPCREPASRGHRDPYCRLVAGSVHPHSRNTGPSPAMTTTSAAPGERLSFLIMRGENANVQVRKGDRILGTHRVTGTVRASDLDAAPARPAATAAIRAAAAGLAQTRVETLPPPAPQRHTNGWRSKP